MIASTELVRIGVAVTGTQAGVVVGEFEFDGVGRRGPTAELENSSTL